MAQNIQVLRTFLMTRMYRHSRINSICAKARQIVQDLFAFYKAQPDCLPTSWFDTIQTLRDDEIAQARIIADYIAGMTDRFAVHEHRRLFSTETML